ncbi:phage protein NinX family protein [Pantoea sp. 1B4]|uniref:phage protein NinX family protein n=1 Tax=Pantoea sp. 1B4 TaxID=2804760 RepID=UPI001AA39A6D|nr:phage protein NinX family protein [Pantoea sp. 1B4]MBN1088107.1 DUF2591 family protein [Pantoea sp. 1B4]
MNYAEMTDFEINLAAAHIAMGADDYDWSTEKQEVYIAGMDGGEFLPHAHFNPCNSWADAGPIIVSNKISLHAPSLLGSWSAEFVGSDDDVNDGYEVDYFQHRNINPLRAAMIVFLMMQEQPNA